MNDADWTRLALWVAKPYAYREDRDDVRQIALIGAWRSVEKVRERGGCSLVRAAVQGARWSVAEYLRKQPGGDRCCEVETISLEELESRQWETRCESHEAGVLQELDGEAIWARARTVLTAEEWDVIDRHYRREQSLIAIAAARGCSQNMIWRAHARAKAKLAAALKENH